ncbi:hypothetical protein [Prosthecobacter sp.]|uniref:hypothetical protein n=1 Tax=Prosthecobacter sp. TaxID=1965333 RepID=UPI001DF2E15D|nr:hypothetical protein [Prosthecobacter sp.]MCB1276108.1 hypothetical protein [Prosthecobacter sp.]
MKRAFLLRLGFGLILMTLLPSCGFAFRSAWKNAPVTSGVDGKWKGTWLSDETGHHGNLRCVVGDFDSYLPVQGAVKGAKPMQFFYHATWKSILSGSYKASHNVQKQKDGTFVFKGEHKMPDWAGGLYHYEGTIKGDEFKANYRCSMDHGTYTMKRVR